jgi:uncharacterized protein
MAERSSFSLNPSEFIADGDTVVALGHFNGVHGTIGKRAEAGYAHVWTVEGRQSHMFPIY